MTRTLMHDVDSELVARGNEIHCGRTEPVGKVQPFLSVEGELVGPRSNDDRVIGS